MRQDDGVWNAVALAGPFANNLHFAPDRLFTGRAPAARCR